VDCELESDLEALVRGYVPDGDEASVELALAVLGNDRPMWLRTEFDPGHFTASGFVVSPDGSSLLLIHHGKLDRWLQPGGHIEAEDTTVQAAARREVLEETGVGDLELLGISLVRIDAHEIPQRGREPVHVHIDLGVGFRATSLEIGPLDEVIDARWVPFDALMHYDTDDALRAGAHAVMLGSG
jgi:8-oxo-dGTP pyrophosphatase MutT (NUDIX family)